MLHSATLLQVNPSALCMASASLVITEGPCCGRQISTAQQCCALGHVSQAPASCSGRGSAVLHRRERTMQDVIQVQECLLIVKVVKVIPCGLPSRICAALPANGHPDCSMVVDDVGTRACEGYMMEDPCRRQPWHSRSCTTSCR